MDSELYFYRRVKDEGSIWQEESISYHTGRSVVPFNSAALSTCVFQDGLHVFTGPDCPHDNPLGKDYNSNTDDYEPGWTVLTNRIPNDRRE